MEIQQVKKELSENIIKIDPIGKKLKFILDDEHIIIDGTGKKNVLLESKGDANCTITMSLDTYQKLQEKKIKPLIATLTGKLKVKGDIGLAQKLKQLM